MLEHLKKRPTVNELVCRIVEHGFERRKRRPLADLENSRPTEELADALIGTEGETTGLILAADILASYEVMDDEQKQTFFEHMVKTMCIDTEKVRQSLIDYENEPSKTSYRAFLNNAEPASQEFIRRLNQVPDATGALVRMRADLLRLGKGKPKLEALDLDFRHLFASWFNRGFLVLRPISWESPAHILEKIIAYEAVHAIDSWEDLRRRLEPLDRRCFAFFHPAMPDEPLIFVEVALTDEIPGSVQKLLAEDRAEIPTDDTNTAVFYSISNCQTGLAGVSFGSLLIKQVASDLATELPSLKTFVTLSPIPGLTHWLKREGRDWNENNADQMKAIAADYLLSAKVSNGMPADPVARFHLGNGAIVHAVHPNADISEKGRTQSGGAMVNYLYDLDNIAENHEKFATSKIVVGSSEVKSAANSVSQHQ